MTDKIDKIQDILYETAKNLEVLSSETKRIRQEQRKLSELVNVHHDKLLILEGRNQVHSRVALFFSRHGLAIFGLVAALGAIMYQLKTYIPS